MHGGVAAVAEGAATCSDSSGDGKTDLSDAVFVLNWLFLGGPGIACASQGALCGDTNGDKKIDLSDSVYLLNWPFLGGNVPSC